MSRRLARVLSVGALLVSISAFAAAMIIRVSYESRLRPGHIVVVGDPTVPRTQEVLEEVQREVARGSTLGATGSYWPVLLLFLVLAVLWIGTGALIVSKRPSNWAGWLFVITGIPFPVVSLTRAVMLVGLKAEPGSVPLIGVWATVGELALYPIGLIPLLFLLYPDGRVPSPRWRWVVVALVGGTGLAILGYLFRPGPFNSWIDDGILYENPLGVDAFTWGGGVIALGATTALIAALATVVGVRQRFKRSTGEVRQQMRVLVFVASLTGAFFVLSWIFGVVGLALGSDEGGGGELFFLLTAITVVVGIPVAYLVAILRYRLWDLDVVIKKTVVFGVVATGLTLLVLLVLLAVPALTVGTGLSGWEIGLLAFGIAIGLLIGPLRRWARRLADRIVYRKRATPYEVLTAFSERIGETYSTEDVLPRMVQVLASGTGATSARVLLRVGGEMREVARWPEEHADTGDEHVVPVVHLGEELGALAVRMPANDPMDPGKEDLVADLAAQTGLVLRNVRLIENLRASRQRLVTAQDEERRKLERNIHDGAQQQLVALGVQLNLARRLAERDAPEMAATLDGLQAQTTDALENLRDLARGIYPPLLGDQGLAVALDAQARKAALPVKIEGDGIGRYPQEVEAAIYFCCLEALQNVAKYANASSVRVRLAGGDGSVTFEVIDDGSGFEPARTPLGTGLQGMRDRLEALGGTFDIDSSPSAGTTVRGTITAVTLSDAANRPDRS